MPTPQHGDSQLHDMMAYPLGHLMGIMQDEQEAERTARSLYEAGYTDVVVLVGPLALESLHSRERSAHPLARVWTRLSAYLDDPDVRREALDALGQGHTIVTVYASGAAQQEQAESILSAHGAQAMRYFGRWSITEVSR